MPVTGTGRVATRMALIAITFVAVACSATGSHPKAAGSTSSGVSSTTTTTITPTPTTTTARTQVVIFNPFVASGPGPGVVVTFRTTAQCHPGSEGDSSRTDAYRCFLDETEPNGGNIADPCFTNPFTFSAPLLCFGSPVDLHAVQVVPDSPLLGNTVRPDTDPWTLLLADGQTCVFTQGATAALGTRRLNYVCPQGVIYGDPDRSAQPWTVFYQAKGSNNLVQMAVRVAYT
jgi:hypothetical protein